MFPADLLSWLFSWLQQSIVKSQTVTVCSSPSYSRYSSPCAIFIQTLWRWRRVRLLACSMLDCLMSVLKDYTVKTNDDICVYWVNTAVKKSCAAYQSYSNSGGVDIANDWVSNSSLKHTKIIVNVYLHMCVCWCTIVARVGEIIPLQKSVV